MFDYLFYFNFIGLILIVALGLLLFILYMVSLFVKKEKLLKLVKILKIIFIISIIIIVGIIAFSLIFDNFTKRNINIKAKEYISDKYDIPINDIEVSSYAKGSVAGLCIDSCHSKPYRIMMKTDEGNYCVNAYDLSDKYIYPTKLHWSNEKTDSNSCDEIDYDSYYELNFEK